MLHRLQITLQYLRRGFPSQRPHGEAVVVPPVVYLKLLCEILKGIEGMRSVEPLVVLPVAALHLAVMPWRIGADYLMPDAMQFQMCLEKGGLIPVGGKTVCKFSAVIRLDALNGAGEGFHKVFHKQGGGIGAVFLKGFHKAPPGILINGGILEEMLPNHLAVYKAGGRDKFHIYLDTLAGVVHLLVGLRDILRVRGMGSHDAPLFEETVQPGDGTGIATLRELHPENDKAGVGVAPAHIGNELDFFRGMLVRVVWPPGTVTQGLDGAVITQR